MTFHATLVTRSTPELGSPTCQDSFCVGDKRTAALTMTDIVRALRLASGGRRTAWAVDMLLCGAGYNRGGRPGSRNRTQTDGTRSTEFRGLSVKKIDAGPGRGQRRR
ncbi:hypothetical protein AOLI_G00322120 [Acnodon oligacanthus]